MKAALIIGGVGIALIIFTPALRLLRIGPGSRISDQEYFAQARKRAIGYRLRKAAAANERDANPQATSTRNASS